MISRKLRYLKLFPFFSCCFLVLFVIFCVRFEFPFFFACVDSFEDV